MKRGLCRCLTIVEPSFAKPGRQLLTDYSQCLKMWGIITFFELFHKNIDNFMKLRSINGKDFLQLLDVVHQIFGHIVHRACSMKWSSVIALKISEDLFFISFLFKGSEHSIHDLIIGSVYKGDVYK